MVATHSVFSRSSHRRLTRRVLPSNPGNRNGFSLPWDNVCSPRPFPAREIPTSTDPSVRGAMPSMPLSALVALSGSSEMVL